MANGRRRPIAPVRKLVAAVLGAFAAFVILFGAGMGNWTIGALGVALLVVAIGLVAVTVVRGGARAWVSGTAHVHSVSEPPASSVFGRCELQIVIDAPGLPARSVKIRDPRVPVAKWPRPGSTVPILVAIDDQRHVRIIWDEVPTHAEAANLLPDSEFDFPVDEVLIEQDAPPWHYRDVDNDFLPPSDDLLAPAAPDSSTADLTSELGGLRDEPRLTGHAPGSGVVLEGTLVDTSPATPFSFRPRPSPESSAYDDADAADLDEPDPDAADPGATAVQPATHADEAGSAEVPGDRFHRVGITMLVTDLNRSLAFYRDTLGFVEIDGAEENAILLSGGTRLVLRAARDVAPVNRRLVHLNLEVGDIQAVYQELKSQGVRFTYAPRAVNRGTKMEQWAAAFRDPDGHGVALTQWRDRERVNPE